MKTFKIKLNDTVTGLTNTSWDRDNIVSGRAATEDQLKAATTPMASWFAPNFQNEYYLGDDTDIAAFASSNFGKPSSSLWNTVRALPLDVTVGPYQWDGPNNDGRGQALVNVSLTFPDGSVLTKENVKFTNNYSVENRVYAVRLGEGATFVDTGLTLNFGYCFEATGYIEEGIQGTLIGAYSSNSLRTTIRILGGANKAQLCWPNITELPAANIGCDGDPTFSYRRMCKIVVSGRYARGKSYNWFIEGRGEVGQYCGDVGTNANWQGSGTDSAKIYLLNEQPNNTYRNAILREAKIYDGSDILIRQFQGANINGEIVIVDAVTGNIYRPDAGTLVEVTE